AEQIETRRFDPVYAVAEVDDVEVMLEDLVLRQLAFEQSRTAERDKLAAQRPPVVAIGEKAVVGDLHRDRAESLSDSAGAEVPGNRAKHTVPIQSVVFVEATFLGGYEGGTNVLGHRRDRDVDAANVLEMTEE